MNIFDIARFSKDILIKKRPIYITFFVTNRCNLKCKHCFYWQNLNLKTQELELDEINKFSKSIKDILILNLTGGEPFVRNDLTEIVKIFGKNNKPRILSINTNGYLTEKIVRDSRKILEFYKFPMIVEISLDGTTQCHESIRGKKSFENTVKTFKELKKLEQRHTNLSLSINITFSRLNQHNTKELIGLIEDEFKPNWLNLSLIRGDVKDRRIKSINLELYKECLDLVNAYDRKMGKHKFNFSFINRANQIFVNKIIYETARKNRYQIPCFAGLLSCTVYPNGDISPCEMLDNSMGNLREHKYNLMAVLKSETAENMRKIIMKKKCFCTHECNTSINTLFNPYVIPKIFLHYYFKRGY